MVYGPPAIDAELLDLLVSAEEVRALFLGLDCPIAHWEALRLAQTDFDHVLRERDRIERLQRQGRQAALGNLLRGSLRTLRIRQGALARRINDMLGELCVPEDPTLDEMIVGVLLSSPEGIARAEGWLDRGPVDLGVGEEVADFAATVEAYRRSLIDWRSGELVEISAESLDAPAGVDGSILEDLRVAERFREFADAAQPALEPWEILSLALADRAGVELAADRLAAQRRGEPPHDVNDDLIRFFERILELRSTRADLARNLRAYVASLPLGRFSPSTVNLAIGLVMASPGGRDRARAWLDLPDRYRREAAIRLEGVIGHAQRYERALTA